MECPRCSATLETGSANRSRCPACGFDLAAGAHAITNRVQRSPVAGPRRTRSVIRPIQPPEPKPARAPQPPAPPPIRPNGTVAIDLPNFIALGDTSRLEPRDRMRLEGRVQDAQFALGRGDTAAARAALQAALDLHNLSDNLWLFLAALAENPAEQRDYLEEALARNPQNQIAVEALLRLDGRLVPAETTPAGDGTLEPGEIAGRQIKCPRCGGRLGYHAGDKCVVCRSCGYRILDADDLKRTQDATALQIALLQRKYAARPWNIGARWLRCTSCGAITTLSRLALTTTCRFCDSQHVVRESANLRFEQPDLIVPFSVDQQDAEARVQQHLKSGLRLITRLFADAVERIALQGVYLPFWIFDAEVSVNWSWTNAPAHGQHPVLLGDVLHFAADTPNARLLQRLEPFDVRRGVDYDPRLLAHFPAELYTRDIDRASLDVRSRLVREAMRRARPSLQLLQPGSSYRSDSRLLIVFDSDDDAGRLVLNATTRHMSYRLGLLPVWIGRLIEADGDTQPVLVNGQTGEVVLGHVERKQR